MNSMLSLLETLIGERAEFKADHRIFNSICLIVGTSYIIRILINLILGIRILELSICHIISSFAIFGVFCISRFLRKFETAKFVFFLIILLTFSMNWLFAGGTNGVMLIYYMPLFVLILIIFKQKNRFIVSCSILLTVSLLIFLEYRYPGLIVQKIQENKLSISKYIHFLFVTAVTSLIILMSNFLYTIDGFISLEPGEKKLSNDNLNKKIAELNHNLTGQEKKVMELIVNGKTNKEIAQILYIDVSTVKTHINNIYRKIKVRDRAGIFTLLNT